jgi:Serine/Threonine/Tyrosine Kinase found in polyvalent proteins
MYSNETKKELNDIICGTSIITRKDTLTATRNYLCTSFTASTKIEKNFDYQARIKKEQSEYLKKYIIQNNLWIENIEEENQYLTEGGEAKIFFNRNKQIVIKHNDAIYYNHWLDFLNSILIHNLIFSTTSYKLLGFKLINDILFAVLEQPFIMATGNIDLKDVEIILGFNGFYQTRKNDYYNKELGLILEDIHDENVILNNDTIFFIDTIFYINLLKK